MLLALDIGNTNITAGVYNGEALVGHWRLSSRRGTTADEFAVYLSVAFKSAKLQFCDITGVAIASVVPGLTPAAVQFARAYLEHEALVLGPNTETGLINDYNPPGDVGADRLVNAMAARAKYGTAALIVDFGTATTIDAVTADGHYLGGAIAPGLQISTDALFSAAARLPRVELVAPPLGLGRNTAHSLQIGIIYGYAGLVKELISRTLPELGAGPVTVLATGGLAELVAPHVPAIGHIEPFLTLDGLRLLWQRYN